MSEVKSIVLPYRPQLIYPVVFVFVALMAGAFLFGKSWERQILKDEMQEKARLEILAEELAATTALQQQQLSRVELNLQVDSAALESTRQEMIVLQKSIYQRDEELKLYRELLQDGSQPTGLSVADIKLDQLDDGRVSLSLGGKTKDREDEDAKCLGKVLGLRDCSMEKRRDSSHGRA